MFCGYGYGYGGLGFGPWNFVMMGIGILIFIGIIVFASKLINNNTTNSSIALKMLGERFAKGEISEEEYLKKRDVVTQKK